MRTSDNHLGAFATVPQPQLSHEEWTLVESPEALLQAADQLANGLGPVGVDAERASGYTYFSQAYLVQMSRRGAGTFVFDPTLIDDFDPLAQAIDDDEWILHSAIADLDCLQEIGLTPPSLFDTELSARLLGMERVGLGAVVNELLGVELAKAHSASDWSKRPLPHDWLEYAALDVSYLPDLRDAMHDKLVDAEKLDIASQEFEAVLHAPPKEKPLEPWRKISGLGRVKNRVGLSIARELWIARDQFAQSVDTAPGRLLPDSAIIAASLQQPRSMSELAKNKDFKGRASHSELRRWWLAILRGKKSDDLPSLRTAERSAFPHHRNWERKKPEAHQRLVTARAALEAESERLNIPLENLLKPIMLRELAWAPPEVISDEAVALQLEKLGARPWQRDATSQIIARSFVETQ